MINTRRKGKQRRRMGALDLEGNNLKQGHQGRSERVTFDQRLKKRRGSKHMESVSGHIRQGMATVKAPRQQPA